MKACITLLLLLPSVVFSQNSDWVYRNPYPQNNFNSAKFFNASTGFIAGSNGTILKTTNGCLSFQSQYSALTGSINSLYFFNSSTGFACGDESSIIFTPNGGSNWNIITQYVSPHSLSSITFADQNNAFACGTSGLLMRSSNGGMNWIITSQNTQLNFNYVYFINPLKGFICADSGKMYVTLNGGNSWAERNVTTQNLLCINFIDSLKGFMGTGAQSVGSSSNLYSTTDGGNNWENVPMLIVTRNWHSISFINQNTGFVMGEEAPVLITTNGGLYWNVYGVPPTTTMRSSSVADTSIVICGTNGWISKLSSYGDQTLYGGSKKNFTSVSFINENTGIIISDYQQLTTTNSGVSWNIKMLGGANWHEGHTTYAIWTSYFTSGNLYMQYHTYIPTVVGEETIYSSSNNGVNWNFGYNARGYINGMDETEGVVYISTLSFPSGIYKSSGGSFSQVYNNTGSSLGKVSFANPNTGLVIGGGSVPGMMKTTNAGKNWSFNPTGNNKEIEGMKLFPSGRGYIAGDSGFFMKTSNFGSNWQLINTGIHQYYHDMKFIDDNNGWLLYISGNWPNNYRLYFTKNGGNNFYPLTSLDNFNVKAFSFVNADIGYVCGDSGVVLKTTNGGLTFMNQNTGIIPDKYSLSQNYPNPFNPVTNIKFDIPQSKTSQRDVSTRLIVYDLLGREVTTLVNKQMQAGSYSVDWDASNYPSGVYFYKIIVGDNTNNGGFVESKKMVLVK